MRSALVARYVLYLLSPTRFTVLLVSLITTLAAVLSAAHFPDTSCYINHYLTTHGCALKVMNEQLDRVTTEESSPAIGNHVEAVLANMSIIAVLLGSFDLSEETLEGRLSAEVIHDTFASFAGDG